MELRQSQYEFPVITLPSHPHGMPHYFFLPFLFLKTPQNQGRMSQITPPSTTFLQYLYVKRWCIPWISLWKALSLQHQSHTERVNARINALLTKKTHIYKQSRTRNREKTPNVTPYLPPFPYHQAMQGMKYRLTTR